MKMKKIVIPKAGGYQVLTIGESEVPLPKEQEVLIRVQASGVNYADCCIRWGVYESAKKYVGWPITPGFEVAGTVESIGNKVTRYKVGDRVFGVTLFNGYSTHVCIPEKHVFQPPTNWGFGQQAGLLATGITAYHALFQIVRIREGGNILVHSAAGGVGSMLLQLARAYGLTSFAVVGSDSKIQHANKSGANFVFSKSDNRWKEKIGEKLNQLGLSGFDAVFDANGGKSYRESYDWLVPTGKLVVYGSHTILPKEGGKIDYFKLIKGYLQTLRFNPFNMITDNKSVAAFNLSFLFEREDLVNDAVPALIKLANEGKLTPPHITIFPYEKVGEAHALLESGKSIGKIILDFSDGRTLLS